MNFGSLVTTQCPEYFHSSSSVFPNTEYNSYPANSPDFWTSSPNFSQSSSSSSPHNYYLHNCYDEAQPSSQRPLSDSVTFPLPKARVVKRRVSANKKERRRTLSINSAFMELRDCIPHVPLDTKLSKIKTLRLATTYISYLMDALNADNPQELPEDGFHSILTKALETREDRRKRDVIMAAMQEKKRDCGKNRTGWPQHVWALELKHRRGTSNSQASKNPRS